MRIAPFQPGTHQGAVVPRQISLPICWVSPLPMLGDQRLDDAEEEVAVGEPLVIFPIFPPFGQAMERLPDRLEQDFLVSFLARLGLEYLPEKFNFIV